MSKKTEEGEKNSSPKRFNYSLLLQILLPSLLLVMLISSFWFGLSGDEPYANGMGKAAWDFIKSFGKDRRIFDLPDIINRDGVLTYYGNIFDIICIWLGWISPFDEYTTRHLFNAFVGWLGIYFTAQILKRYWGARAATIGALMIFLFPFYFGHAMNNPKDVPMAAFYVMGVFFLLRFFERYDRLNTADYLWLIAAIILAIDVRVSGLLLITYIPILALLHFDKIKSIAASKGWLKTLAPMLIVAVASYLGCSIFWPYAALNPITNPINALNFLSNFKVAMPAIWEGAMNNSKELPSNYLIRSIMITSPWVFLLGLLAGAASLLMFWKQISAKRILAFVVFTSLFPLIYIIFKQSNVYHLWRHVIFVLPGLIVLAALGYENFSRFIKSPIAVGMIAFFLLLLEPIFFTAKTFPNNVNYFNSMVEGVEGAYGNYDMDFYYNSMKPCIDYLEQEVLQNATDTVTIMTNGYHLADQYWKDRQEKFPLLKLDYARYPEKNMIDWDYAIFHNNLVPLEEIQTRTYGTYNNPVFINSIEELPLCIVYKRPSHEDYLGLKPIEPLLKGETAPISAETVQEVKTHLGNYLQADPNNGFVRGVYDYINTLK